MDPTDLTLGLNIPSSPLCSSDDGASSDMAQAEQSLLKLSLKRRVSDSSSSSSSSSSATESENEYIDHERVINDLFFKSIKKDCLSTAIVFHCEYSKKRSPPVAKKMRSMDRNMNFEPGILPTETKLYYPHVYLLHGGYRKFFKKFPEDCNPRNYVKMKRSKSSNELISTKL